MAWAVVGGLTWGRGASARGVAMDDGPILETLITADKPWAGWGPSVGGREDVEWVTRVLVKHSGLSEAEIRERSSQDGSRYLLLRLLSSTTHAAVFVAIDRVLARRVVVKIHSDVSKHATQRAIFESQVMAQLSHPNVATIHDMGEQPRSDQPRSDQAGSDQAASSVWMYSVIELCDCDLEAWCQGFRSRKWHHTLDRLIEAARGLAYLHERGYAHGDIKPTNILISSGAAKLADFGFTVKPDRDAHCCVSPGFTAPEVLGFGAGLAGDVFAFAVTAWLCLFDELPFPYPPDAGLEVACTVVGESALDGRIKPPDRIPPGLPTLFRMLLEQALHGQAGERPEIHALLDGMIAARDWHERRQRRRWLAPRVTAGAAVVLAAGIAIGATQYGGRGEPGALVEVAVVAFDPLTLAEIAAKNGDGQAALEQIYKLHWLTSDMSKAELQRTADRISGIAETLQATGTPDEAEVAAGVAVYFGVLARGTPKPPPLESK